MNAITCALVIAAQLSWYDPARCDVSPINCFDPARWWNMAAGHDARNWYDRALACPMEFAIGSQFEIRNSWHGLADGIYTCLDRGGAIVTRNGVSVLDLLRDTPVWSEVLPVRVARPCQTMQPTIAKK